MAEFAGFDIETPQEVLARVQQANGTLQQQAQRSGDTRQIDQANLQASLNSMFGMLNANRAEKKNKEYTGAVAEALRALPDNASAEQRSQARNRAMFDVAVEQGDAQVALKAAEQEEQALVAERERADLLDKNDLDKRRIEQNISKSQVEQEKAKLDLEIAKEADGMMTAASADFKETATFDVTTEQGKASADKWMEEHPGAFIGPSIEMMEILHEDQGSLLGKNQFARIERDLSSDVMALDQAISITRIITENPGALSAAGRLTAGGSRVAQQMRAGTSIAMNLFTSELDLQGTLSDIEIVAKRFNMDRATIDGLFAPMVFALTVASQGTRPTDRDITRLARAVGGETGQVDPDLVVNLFDLTIRGNAGRNLERASLFDDARLLPFAARSRQRVQLWDETRSAFSLGRPEGAATSASHRAADAQRDESDDRLGFTEVPRLPDPDRNPGVSIGVSQ